MRSKAKLTPTAIWRRMCGEGFKAAYEELTSRLDTDAKPFKKFLLTAPQCLMPKGWPVEQWNISAAKPISKQDMRRLEAYLKRTRFIREMFENLDCGWMARRTLDWQERLERELRCLRHRLRKDEHYCPFNIVAVIWVKQHLRKGKSLPWEELNTILQASHRVRGSGLDPCTTEALRASSRRERYEARPPQRKKAKRVSGKKISLTEGEATPSQVDAAQSHSL